MENEGIESPAKQRAPKIVLIVGAGSTLSDAMNKSLKETPPVDKGFFKACNRVGYSEFNEVKQYLDIHYEIDPLEPAHDSLEGIMAIIYADINSPSFESDATTSFIALMRLFTRRIADSTNSLSPSSQGNLYRIITKLLSKGCAPGNLCIVTFNQDLHAEKVLFRIHNTSKWQQHGPIISFPHCYQTPILQNMISRPSSKTVKPPEFATSKSNSAGVRLLKLHGSLNWFSRHTSRNIPHNSILNKTRKIRITTRRNVAPDMTHTSGKKMHTFPLVVPPVNHKDAIIHEMISPLWGEAESALESAEHIIVFGYSCPTNDLGSVNLMRRSVGNNSNLRSFSVIDPDPNILARYAKVTNRDHLSYFASCNAYIKQGRL